MAGHFTWIAFYMEFAERLLPYAHDRLSLIDKIKEAYTAIGMHLPKLERDDQLADLDPFTVYGLFNKKITDANRVRILRGMAKAFSVKAPVPEDFGGVPLLNNQRATFYYFKGERQEDDIENLWKMFSAALAYGKTHLPESRAAFAHAYDTVLKQKGIKWNITMALYWMNPHEYVNLDSRSRWFLTKREHMPQVFIDGMEGFAAVPGGERYLQISGSCREVLSTQQYPYTNFPELSLHAWAASQAANEETRARAQAQRASAGEAIGDRDIPATHYWIYAPGNNASMWDEFYDKGIMGIGWSEIGDLSAFATKDAMKQRMKECIDPNNNFRNAAYATWQFANEMKPGDVVFVKKGVRRVVGRGIVTSDYQYEAEGGRFPNIRQMEWTDKGEWEYPGQAIMKTLTDITAYTQDVRKLNALFEDEVTEEAGEPEGSYPSYDASKFLGDVYMSQSAYQTLVSLLRYKKNLILQGAPGVGKTFAAKRLAYSMMGKKDVSRVAMVQFHQSYSYEDFIMGFRPTATGFELKKGPFYTFCKQAETDLENEYFFIIDEINRGNLSKIFGELFMLLENDKRGASLQLLYADEMFSVPENVYVIGLMNTADRSLAMLDYALRRRFAFFEMTPAFQSEGFRAYREAKHNPRFDRLIATVERLNEAIEADDSLGRGFRIGHGSFDTKQEIDEMWLNNLVNYELLPLLNEYWFDEPGKVREWEHARREAIR